MKRFRPRFRPLTYQQCAFMFGQDLLPAVPRITGLERVGTFDARPSDTPSVLDAQGRIVPMSDWAERHATPADLDRWYRSQYNLVLHTRSVYGLRVPFEQLAEFMAHVSPNVMAVREGRRNSIVLLFRVAFSVGELDKASPVGYKLDDLTEVPALSRRVMAERYGKSNRFITGTLDPIEFLGHGCTVLLHGTAANGAEVSIYRSKGLQAVPFVELAALEAFWRRLQEEFAPYGVNHRWIKPLMDQADVLGRFLYPALLAKLPAFERSFIEWLAAHGRIVGFEGSRVLALCPWHWRIRTKTSHRPAVIDLESGEMMCSHDTCVRHRRTLHDFARQYGFTPADKPSVVLPAAPQPQWVL